ncbi:MAG: hypothetical protein C0444_05970 [Microbacterium sp.]|nr:hypothetical protein [Microbacterium sp.]MBA4345003.1 hypothetical protein [Microbacterium sp.]
MSIEEQTTRTRWWGNRTKLTIALAVAGALVLGGGAASATVVSLQVAAAEQAEADRVAAAAYKTAVTQHNDVIASGNALVKDLRASLVVGTGLVDQAAIDEANRLAEYLSLTLAAAKTSESTEELQEQIDAIEAAIAEAQGGLENMVSLATSAAEARLAAASLAGEQIRQKVTAALSALASGGAGGKSTADALAALAAALTSAEASHQAAVAAQEAENSKPNTESKPPTKPQPDKTVKPPVDTTGWYTKEEASAAVIAAYGAVPWYDGCVKVGDGYWYRSGGSPSSPPAPPAVTGALGFKVEIINAEKAWVYYYDCP